MDTNENLKTALATGAAIGDIKKIGAMASGTPAVVIPEGYKLVIPDIDEAETWLAEPLRKKGNFAFADVDSFIRYFNEHKNDDSRVFSYFTDTSGRFRGVLNFHGKAPAFQDHTCEVALTQTREWAIWCGSNRKPMSQAAFATFLEENADMFVEPTGAALLELVQTLEGKNHVNVKSAIKMNNGSIKLAYDEEMELKGGTGTQAGEMEIPALFKVGIAPFEGVARYQMQARLRYRIESRKISLWYEAVDSHLVVRAVCADLTKVVTEKTGLVPFKA